MLQKTALFNEHVKLNAKIVDFAGWEMPVMYSSIIDEHRATRSSAGLFDVSHMTEFRIKGPGSAAFLSSLIPTRLGKLEPCKSMYSAFCNEQGGVIDDLFIYMISQDEYYIVANAGTYSKDLDWMNQHTIKGIEIIDETPFTSKIDLQGPKSKEIILHVINDKALDSLQRFYFGYFSYKGEKIIISQSGYTGEHGYEFYINNSLAPSLWNDILDAGNDLGIKPVGLGARDTLRLESCYSLYGHELSDTITLPEAGLKWLISSDTDYIGKHAIELQLHAGAPREMIAFELKERGVPRDGNDVCINDNAIGTVTSGTFSPTFNKGIGLALVKRGILNQGDPLTISIRSKNYNAQVVQKPFYHYNEVS